MSSIQAVRSREDPREAVTEDREGVVGRREDDPELSRDDVFHLLRNRRRRYALHYLKGHEGAARIGEVAEQVAAWEFDVPVETVSGCERKRVYNSLQQTHFPQLDDTGFVEYDARSGRVELTDRADRLDVYLEVVHERDVPWSTYYLGLSGFAGALLVALQADLYPVTVLPDLAWMAFVVVAFAVSAAVNAYLQRQERLGTGGPPPEARGDGR